MIYIDTREPPKISRYAKEVGMVFEEIELPVGDIVDNEKGICIERKDMHDLVNSFRSGHLDKQLMQMEAFDHPFLLISGTPEDLAIGGHVHWTAEHQTGLLKHLMVRFPKLKVAQTRNDHQLVMLTKKLIEATNDGKKIDITQTELFKLAAPETPEDVHALMLTAIPGIGIVTARALLAKYPFHELFGKTSKELEEVDGIGKKTAEKIKTYFTTPTVVSEVANTSNQPVITTSTT